MHRDRLSHLLARTRDPAFALTALAVVHAVRRRLICARTTSTAVTAGGTRE
jgi:hypothetical protein